MAATKIPEVGGTEGKGTPNEATKGMTKIPEDSHLRLGITCFMYLSFIGFIEGALSLATSIITNY